MIVKVEIDITPQQYFMHLCKGVIKDIKNNTGRQVTLKDIIDGYYYDRTIKNKKTSVVIHMRVGRLIQDKYFELSYDTSQTKGSYYYDFSTENGKYYVTYFEENDYKEDGAGSYLGRIRKRLGEKTLQQKIIRNIELTTTYIKNQTNI